MIRSLRFRLTAWYLGFCALLLVLFSVFLYGVLSRALESRLDQTLTSDAVTAAGLLEDEMGEMNGDAPRAAAEAVSEMQIRGVVIAVFDSGKLLASSATDESADWTSLAAGTAAATDSVRAVPEYGRYGARAAARRLRVRSHEFLVLAVASLGPIVSDLRVLRGVLYLALPLVLALAGIGGFWLTRRALMPLNYMAAQARTITSSNLHDRLNIGDAAEELNVLAVSFNELLSRLDQSFETMRRFVADASHELRTPLSIIRGEADVALSRDRSPAEYQEALALIQDETRRLTRLVDDLLNLARADAGHVRLQVQDFYLNDLLSDCCRSVQALALARTITLECSCSEDVTFRGDEELVRRMVINLLDNAIRYTPAGGRVSASLETQRSELRLRISDTGLGIAPEAATHVFERFYRVDKARSRQEGGFGLGLAIVKWVAESHHGAVEVTSQPGAGSTFTVVLHR
ncbi:MAG TPA: heavy metal sensor histidine kinase [Bryobacteraceae bacterium]|nr:heavy metal sensor histidine kinase [Bryobacteraceae bacterium]